MDITSEREIVSRRYVLQILTALGVAAPMAAEIAAHERYLRLLAELNDALDRGDSRGTGTLRAQVERAQGEWHRLVRAADDAMRDTRPR